MLVTQLLFAMIRLLLDITMIILLWKCGGRFCIYLATRYLCRLQLFSVLVPNNWINIIFNVKTKHNKMMRKQSSKSIVLQMVHSSIWMLQPNGINLSILCIPFAFSWIESHRLRKCLSNLCLPLLTSRPPKQCKILQKCRLYTSDFRPVFSHLFAYICATTNRHRMHENCERTMVWSINNLAIVAGE